MNSDDKSTNVTAPLQQQVTTLSETSPVKHGLLEAYYEPVRQAIESCSCSYPSTNQLKDNLPESEITPRMLGNILVLLVDLDIIGVQSDRNNGAGTISLDMIK